MEQLTKNQAVATSQEAVQNQNRSEERFSRNAETDLVCRLLLDKKTFCWFTDLRRGPRRRRYVCPGLSDMRNDRGGVRDPHTNRPRARVRPQLRNVRRGQRNRRL